MILHENFTRTSEDNSRLATWSSQDRHIEPRKFFSYPSAKGFSNCFFHRKASSVVDVWQFLRIAIRAFFWREEPVEEFIPKLLDGFFNPFNLDHVDAYAKDLHYEMDLTPVALHQLGHFSDGLLEADTDRTSHDRVTDVEFGEMWHIVEVHYVSVIDTVSRIDLET